MISRTYCMLSALMPAYAAENDWILIFFVFLGFVGNIHGQRPRRQATEGESLLGKALALAHTQACRLWNNAWVVRRNDGERANHKFKNKKVGRWCQEQSTYLGVLIDDRPLLSRIRLMPIIKNLPISQLGSDGARREGLSRKPVERTPD